jgi:hypothetical protein
VTNSLEAIYLERYRKGLYPALAGVKSGEFMKRAGYNLLNEPRAKFYGD